MNPDLRLAVPAVVAWVAVGIVIGAPQALVATSLASWALAFALVTVAFVARSALPQRVSGILVGGAVVAGAVGLLLSSAAVNAPSREPALLVSAADSGRRAELVMTTTETVSASSSSVSVTITHATISGRSADVEVPARVLFDASDTRIPLGAVIRMSGSLTRTDPGDDLAFLVFAEGPIETVDDPPWILMETDALRAGLRELSGTLPGDGGDLLPGLAVGDTGAVSRTLDQDMKDTSLSHLTAVSGANCAVVVGLVLFAGGLIGLRRAVRISLAVAVLAGFVILVTPEPSVLRAAVMALVVLLGVVSGRPSRGIPILALAVIVLLVVDPWLARDFGFILSVLATGGLLLLAGPLTRSLARVLPSPIAAIISIPVAAQLACQPVIVLLSPTLPTYGVLANILAAPAAPIGTVLGLAACLLQPVLPPFAALIVHVAWLPAAWIAGVARFFAAAPGARLDWLGGAGGVAVTAALTTALIVVSTSSPRSARVPWWSSFVLVCLIAVGYVGIAGGVALRSTLTRPSEWMYGACDVGQGDASLVRSSGHVAVIDVGREPDLMSACLDTLGIGRVDLLVLTHFDLDHIGGFEALVGRTDEVLVGPMDREEARRVVDALRTGGAQVTEVSRGVTGRLGALRWTVLWPTDPLRGTEPGNDASVTMLFDAGEGCSEGCPSGIFLGDLGENAQARMLGPTSLGEVDVVKVAHHGSSDQSAGLYDRLDSTVALIGVGADNDYGHPTDELLDILHSAGTVVTRTDQDGLVLLSPQPGGGLEIWREH